MRIHVAICAAILLAVILSLSGCGDPIAVTNYWTESRGVTSNAAATTLNFTSGSSWSETLSAYDTVSTNRLNGMQVLGLSNYADAAFLVADPNYNYFPALTTNYTQASNSIYLSPVGNTVRANIHEDSMSGAGLYEFTSLYQVHSYSTSVANLEADIASLAANRVGMFVVCASSPLGYSRINTTSISYRNTSAPDNLQTAISAIRWDSIYGSSGFSGTQNLRIMTLDAYKIDITNQPGNAGVFADSLVAVVYPDNTNYTPPTPAAKSLRVDLGWNKPVDLDLHLVRNNPPVYHELYDTVNDCFWQRNALDWGISGDTSDDPQFVRDSRDGSSTEEIYLGKMTAGDSYAVAVDYWGDPWQNVSHIPVTGTVYIWVNGVSTPITFTSAELSYGAPWDINPRGEFTIVCDVNGTTGNVVQRSRDRSILQRPAFRAGSPLLRKK
ncbi:MAG: hypothetical protein WCJ56_14065 [bacterium]